MAFVNNLSKLIVSWSILCQEWRMKVLRILTIQMRCEFRLHFIAHILTICINADSKCHHHIWSSSSTTNQSQTSLNWFFGQFSKHSAQLRSWSHFGFLSGGARKRLSSIPSQVCVLKTTIQAIIIWISIDLQTTATIARLFFLSIVLSFHVSLIHLRNNDRRYIKC